MNHLAAALSKAQKAVNAVEKDATNTFHRYKYASAESLIEEGRRVLSEADLTLSQVEWEFKPDHHSEPVIGRLHITYELTHSSGEKKVWTNSSPVIPEKGRPPDKAEWATLTENYGYTIRGLLMIPRQDSVDVSGRDDRPKTEPKPQPKPEPKSEPVEPPADGLLALKEVKTKAECQALPATKFASYSKEEKNALAPFYKARLAELPE